ncbi:MAG TPA: APC family permease [Bryobacteraceae bacterium]|nr:APC family permease [Bryobacteraceae bacterium]
MAAPNTSASLNATGSPASLVRALGVGDLTWLYLVAIVNLNVLPVAAAEGLRAVWLWAAAILFFFLPQGIAVIELGERMPGEGGLYLWTKETYGDFHGFLCGWAYWMTNLFFVPSLLFYVTGITAYIFGAHSPLAQSRLFFWMLTNALLWLTVLANIRGLGVGKWVNNIGGVGALIIAVVLMVLAVIIASTPGHTIPWNDLSIRKLSNLPYSTIGVVCLAMVGLEIGPVMGDEVRDPRRTFPRAILLGGILCAIAYVGATASLALAVPSSQMVLVQGTMQAIDKMSAGLSLGWMLLPLAVLMIASIAGSTSAWVSGSARILFVSGLDRYLPQSLGKIHPRHGSPYVALAMFGLLASAIITMSFAGASVQEAYLTLLDLSVALQMISYLYLFASLLRRAFARDMQRVYFGRAVLRAGSVAGFAMTSFGFAMAFVPSRQIASIWSFELKMLITLAAILGLAGVLFRYYSLKRPATGPQEIIPT